MKKFKRNVALLLLVNVFFACNYEEQEVEKVIETTELSETEAAARIAEDNKKTEASVLKFETEHPDHIERMKLLMQNAATKGNANGVPSQNKLDIGTVTGIISQIQNHYYDDKFNIQGASLSGILNRIRTSTESILNAIGEVPNKVTINDGRAKLLTAADLLETNRPIDAFYKGLEAYNSFLQAYPYSILNLVEAQEFLLVCRYAIAKKMPDYPKRKQAFTLYSIAAYNKIRQMEIYNYREFIANNDNFDRADNFLAQFGLKYYQVYAYFRSRTQLWKPNRNVPVTLKRCKIYLGGSEIHMNNRGFLINRENSGWSNNYVCYNPYNQVAFYYANPDLYANLNKIGRYGLVFDIPSFNYPCFDHRYVERRVINSDNNYNYDRVYLAWGPNRNYYNLYFSSQLPPPSTDDTSTFDLIPYGDNEYCVVDKRGNFMTSIYQFLDNPNYTASGHMGWTGGQPSWIGTAPSISIRRSDGSLVR
jgi:hypothetical protein